ncbi:uncharacterized protein [Misgurnus anguillicaudatus]|uniref:uncharacterized protein n=1 Tax=Misgurnus anguillicaudatus TaxID=75329 RepID=UPI003CCF5007
MSSSESLLPSPPPKKPRVSTFPLPPNKYGAAPASKAAPASQAAPGTKVKSRKNPLQNFSEDLFATPPSAMTSSQQGQHLSPILEQSTPQSMDSTKIETPKRTKQTFRGHLLPLPSCTSTPYNGNPKKIGDVGQSDETPQANKTSRKPRTPQGRYTRGDVGQSDETPQANRTTHQSRTPQARCSQEKQDKFPMSDKKFQRKVLMLLVEIKEELRRIGCRVEPDTDFHLSTLATEEEFQNLEKQLESQRTQAAMVCKLCQIGGRNLKDSARRMLDRVLKNSLMSQFNMKGGGPLLKKAFEKTALFSVIKDAVLNNFPEATELEVKAAIGGHFKQAPGRTGGGGYKSKYNE